MEVAIAKYFGIRQFIIVPNISWGFGMHECDLFLIKRSGVAIEIELKRSKSDLLADFEKRHHHQDKQNRISEFFIMRFLKKLYESCKDLIPPDAGIITCYRWTDYKKQERVDAHTKREPKKIKGARKLTVEEQLKVARLGCMRFWSLKEKIIKNGRIKFNYIPVHIFTLLILEFSLYVLQKLYVGRFNSFNLILILDLNL